MEGPGCLREGRMRKERFHALPVAVFCFVLFARCGEAPPLRACVSSSSDSKRTRALSRRRDSEHERAVEREREKRERERKNKVMS